MIALILLTLFWGSVCAVAGYGEALRIRYLSESSTAWHNFQWLERIGIGVAFFFLGRYIHIDLVPTLGIMFLYSIMFFIVYDGVINKIAFSREFFYVSKTTKAWTEKYAHWYIKIPLMIMVSILNVILLKIYSEEDNENS